MPATPPAPYIERQPVVVFLTGLAAVVGLGLAAATALHWIDLSFEQTASVVVFVSALCGLVGKALHGAVYSPATVKQLTAELTGQGPAGPEEFA